jgi:hypothetical protein
VQVFVAGEQTFLVELQALSVFGSQLPVAGAHCSPLQPFSHSQPSFVRPLQSRRVLGEQSTHWLFEAQYLVVTPQEWGVDATQETVSPQPPAPLQPLGHSQRSLPLPLQSRAFPVQATQVLFEAQYLMSMAQDLSSVYVQVCCEAHCVP